MKELKSDNPNYNYQFHPHLSHKKIKKYKNQENDEQQLVRGMASLKRLMDT